VIRRNHLLERLSPRRAWPSATGLSRLKLTTINVTFVLMRHKDMACRSVRYWSYSSQVDLRPETALRQAHIPLEDIVVRPQRLKIAPLTFPNGSQLIEPIQCDESRALAYFAFVTRHPDKLGVKIRTFQALRVCTHGTTFVDSYESFGLN
jgi:hypothetical protein